MFHAKYNLLTCLFKSFMYSHNFSVISQIHCEGPQWLKLGRVLSACWVLQRSRSSRIPRLRHRDWLPGWFEAGEVSSLRVWTVDMLWHHFVAKVFVRHSKCRRRFVTTDFDNLCPQRNGVCNSLHRERSKSFTMTNKCIIYSLYIIWIRNTNADCMFLDSHHITFYCAFQEKLKTFFVNCVQLFLFATLFDPFPLCVLLVEQPHLGQC